MDPRPAPALGAELQRSLELLHRLFLEVEVAQDHPGRQAAVREILAELRTRPNLAELPGVLLQVQTELAEALSGIRLTRETIRSYSVERLRDTHARLTEVSAATESAAMEMLNGLDRSLALIAELERESDGRAVHARCDALRTEVNQLYGALQFQDIITQQLHGVAALLVEVEQRLQAAASCFDRSGGAAPPVRRAPDPASYNPDASTRNASARQALVDEAFSAARVASPPA